jgi:hypothetical protein
MRPIASSAAPYPRRSAAVCTGDRPSARAEGRGFSHQSAGMPHTESTTKPAPDFGQICKGRTGLVWQLMLYVAGALERAPA